ncbi:hypothetical protein HDV57DRAFT_306604 [Trichoderma longibrachiatum]
MVGLGNLAAAASWPLDCMFQPFHVGFVQVAKEAVGSSAGGASLHHRLPCYSWSCIAATAGLYEVRTKCGVLVLGRGRAGGRCRSGPGPCLARLMVISIERALASASASAPAPATTPAVRICLPHLEALAIRARLGQSAPRHGGIGFSLFASARGLYQKEKEEKKREGMHPPLRTVSNGPQRIAPYHGLAFGCLQRKSSKKPVPRSIVLRRTTEAKRKHKGWRRGGKRKGRGRDVEF